MQEVINKMQEKLSGKTIVIGVSTGVDSMVLWHLVKKLKDVKIIIAHVNHHQREASNKEQAFLEKECQKTNTLYYVKELYFDTHQNFQNEARMRRYSFFKEVVEKEGANYLLLAHHANDDLETIIMRLMKSSSLKGYGGMEEETNYQGMNIYRPLLDVTKQEILEYASINGITYFNDQSNNEDDYQRNRIRHHIIPYLEKENPNLYKDIKVYKKHIFGANEIVFEIINDFIKNNVVKEKGIISFKRSAFIKHNIYMQEQILFDILKPFNLSLDLITELLKEINNEKNTIINHINSELTFVKEYGMLRFGKWTIYPDINKEINKEEIVQILPNTTISIHKNKCYFKTDDQELCYNIDTLPVIIRKRRPGDKITINKQTRSLSDYLTNKKVSHFVRSRLLVLTNTENQVLAILGLDYRR